MRKAAWHTRRMSPTEGLHAPPKDWHSAVNRDNACRVDWLGEAADSNAKIKSRKRTNRQAGKVIQ